MRRAKAGSSYLSQSEPVLTFGLGPAEKAETLEIAWPSGARQTLRDLPANRTIEVVEAKE